MGKYRVARLRFKRAIAHGERLAKLWNDLPTDFLCTPKALLNGDDGKGVLIATNVGAIPDEISLVLGEHLYQLRSALDSCLYQATVYATGKDPPPDETKLEFPITFDKGEWPKVATRRLAALPGAVQEGIMSVQPFQAESLSPEDMVISMGRSLGILHNLARKDRHRQLHVVGSWPVELKPDFTLPDGVSLGSFEAMPPAIIENQTVIARFELNGFVRGMPIGMRPNLKTSFGCAEPPPACHSTDTFNKRLVEMVNAVGSVLDAFEVDF